mgnify:CR=1 FL=1
MEAVEIIPARTALVLIDLQNFIVDLPLAPSSGREVATRAVEFAERLRAAGGVVISVVAEMAGDPRAALHQPVDMPFEHPHGHLPTDWDKLVEGLAQRSDVIVTKRQWGAFYGTDLDLHLRRRRIDAIIIGGIATNYGVESTARQAWEQGYDMLVAEDLTTSFTAELHDFSMTHVLRRISRVRPVADIRFESGPYDGTNI